MYRVTVDLVCLPLKPLLTMRHWSIVQFAVLNPSWLRTRSSLCLMCTISHKCTVDFLCVRTRVWMTCFPHFHIRLCVPFNICCLYRLRQNPPVCLLSGWSSLTLANCFRNKQVRGQWPRCQRSRAGTGVWKTLSSALEKRAKCQTA